MASLFRERYDHTMPGAVAGAALQSLCQAFWDEILHESPEFGVYRGFDRYPCKLDSGAVDKYEHRKIYCTRLLKQSETIAVEELDTEDQITYAVLRFYLEMCLTGLQFPAYLLTVCSWEGPHIRIPTWVLSKLRLQTPQDYEHYLQRIRALPTKLRESQATLEEGMRQGVTHFTSNMVWVQKALLDVAEGEPRHSPFYLPVPQHFSEDIRISYEQEAVDLMEQCVMKPFRQLAQFIDQEYLPRCLEGLSISSLPSGPAWYRQLLLFHCDTNMEPMEMHQLGLREVACLKHHILQIMSKLEFQGTMQEFAKSLFKREEFFFTSQDDLYSYCQQLLDERIRPALKKIFPPVPSMPLKFCTSKSRTGQAVYSAPSHSDNPVGELWFTDQLDKVAKYSLPTLMLHEAEPGHHLQSCYAIYKANLPEFRRYKDDISYIEAPGRFPMNTAYTEGWGLYCEELGLELGVYHDLYEEFGFHDQNIKRAVRMVVDTGIHALGWSAEQALEYMQENSPFQRQAAESEIRRYSIAPAQACAYKYGHLRLKELRKYAEDQLGPKFDIRAFHRECLRHGQIPLQILQDCIKKFVAQHKDS